MLPSASLFSFDVVAAAAAAFLSQHTLKIIIFRCLFDIFFR